MSQGVGKMRAFSGNGRVTGLSGLVTLVLTAGVWSCGNDLTCGPGTTLKIDPEGNQFCAADAPPCEAPNTLVNGVCMAPLPPACDQTIDCTQTAAAWADSTERVRVRIDGPTQCSCEAEVCKDGYTLYNGRCVSTQVDCEQLLGPGYRNEGGGCVPLEDCTCSECPGSPICLQVRCEEYPALRGQTNDFGRNLCNEDPPPPAESCVEGCHTGIEDPHPWFGGPQLSCTGCHGGDATARTRELAHVALPEGWQDGSPQIGRPNLRYYSNYLTLFGVENFTGGLEWLRFRNPSDLRIADQSCGKAAGCHQDRVENVKRSVMATEVGLTGGGLARNGVNRSVIRGNGGIYKWDVTEAMTLGEGQMDARVYNRELVGSVQRLTQFKIFNRETNGAYGQVDLLREVYDKQCGDCHLGSAGANNRYADFRTSGCGSCHMSYRLDGRSESSDQMIKKDEPSYPAAWAQIANFNANDLANLNQAYLGPERPHPRKHRLTKTMTSQRCGTCHVGSNRTDWQYRGYRFDPNRDAVLALDNNRLNANQIQFTDEIDNNADANARYHGAAQNQILKYEDWNNDGLDDSPADIHYVAGLECMDCHTSAEMHNELKFVRQAQVTDWADPTQVVDMSGAIWTKMDQSTEIECVHCHGNLEYRAVPHEAENRNPIKNMIACPEAGETIANYTVPAECDRLGSGRWLKSKFTGRYHYVTQTKDTVQQVGQGVGGGATTPRGSPVYSLNASIFHGRFNGQDLSDGAGPCPAGDVQNCYKDQVNNVQQVTQGFSHLGSRAQNSVDQHAGGMECYACHATWVNACFGCHLTLADNNGNNILRDFSRSTGELTYGVVTQADFGYIDPLAIQLGINSEGKIAQFLPETKQGFRHVDANNNDYFSTQVIVNNNANLIYNVYRQRSGYGLRQYATEQVGLPLNSDGQEYEQYAQMDQNAGQGFNQFMPHSVQRSHPMMDCNFCHLDANNNNANAVQARLGVNPNGFANVSAYLAALDNLAILKNNTNQPINVDVNAGFRFDANIDPDAFTVDQQLDWVVFNDGFPLSYSNHPLKEGTIGIYTDPFYNREYPRMARISGPLNQALLNKMLNDVRNNNVGVQFKSIR
jgi:hypothetical protein